MSEMPNYHSKTFEELNECYGELAEKLLLEKPNSDFHLVTNRLALTVKSMYLLAKASDSHVEIALDDYPSTNEIYKDFFDRLGDR